MLYYINSVIGLMCRAESRVNQCFGRLAMLLYIYISVFSMLCLVQIHH